MADLRSVHRRSRDKRSTRSWLFATVRERRLSPVPTTRQFPHRTNSVSADKHGKRRGPYGPRLSCFSFASVCCELDRSMQHHLVRTNEASRAFWGYRLSETERVTRDPVERAYFLAPADVAASWPATFLTSFTRVVRA